MSTRQYGNGRSKILSVRVSPEEHDQLLREAETVGLGIGEYTRARLFGATSTPPIHAAAASYASLESLAPALTSLTAAVAQAQAVLQQHTIDPD